MPQLLALMILSNFVAVIAQSQDTCFEQCSALVILQLNEQFFSALRKVESDGDVCMINGNRIGPYQISEQYYDGAAECRPSLQNEGMRWGFVWGKDSRIYSEEVIKSYICREAMRRSHNNQLSISGLARLHKGGFQNLRNRSLLPFGNTVTTIYNNGSQPNDTSAVCFPECKPGQCCMDGKCYCFDADNNTMKECPVECDTAGLRLDLVFIIDSSGSIGSSNFNALKQSIENIVTPLTISRRGTRVAVVQFSTDVSLLFNLNAHEEKESLLEAIRNIRYIGGFTDTAEALRLLRTSTLNELLGVRPVEGIPVAILITDGQSNNPTDTKLQALALRNSTEFEVFVVGIGNNVRKDELINIAGDPQSVIQIENFNASEFDRFENLFAVQACRASDSVPPDTDVTSTVGQGAVDYYRVQIPDEGVTLRFDVEDGRVLICGSRANRNPDCRDASTYEWRCEANSYCDIYVASETRKRQVGTSFIFVSIEGINRNNEVVIETMMGDEAVSEVMSLVILTDTVIFHDDPLYEVPVTHTSEGMDPTTTSLCYQIHGESNNYYNLISDTCIQVNVFYAAFSTNSDAANYIKAIGILAHDSGGSCIKIELQTKRCKLTIDDSSLNGSYSQNKIEVVSTGKQSYEVNIPNCKATQGDDLKFRMACQKVSDLKVIQFSVIRGGGLRPSAHGIVSFGTYQ
ncbi:uncharacterized protein [Dysidea avara]|uniref:uncharacterized protein isoform X3 n=1 Tax=Dysidea avara TaxID=196820 RepID=UPI003333AB06